MSISRNLIRLVEDIENEEDEFLASGSSGSDMLSFTSGSPSGSGMSSRSSMSSRDVMMDDPIDATDTPAPMLDTGDVDPLDAEPMPMDDPMTASVDMAPEMDLPEDKPNTGATVTIATQKGTNVTVSEMWNSRPKRQRRISEAFFKTPGDVNNFYNGDDPDTIFRKRDEANWMNEAEEDPDGQEQADDYTMSTSGSDGRKVKGSVTDDNGTQFDIDGTLAFSGDDLEIEDIDLEAVSSNGGNQDNSGDTQEDPDATDNSNGLQKSSNAETVFEERLLVNEDNQKPVTIDPIGDMMALKARKSGKEDPMLGKPRKDPVRKVTDNSLKNRREFEIEKMRKGLEGLKDARYQTKPESDE